MGKIKRSVGTRAAEEAAREEREKIDAMYILECGMGSSGTDERVDG